MVINSIIWMIRKTTRFSNLASHRTYTDTLGRRVHDNNNLSMSLIFGIIHKIEYIYYNNNIRSAY